MSRPRGSIIGAKPSWTTTATSGIWSLRQAEEMKADGKWPRGPVAPTSLAGTPGDGQVALTWTAPATTHGTITGYVVECTPNGGATVVVATGSTTASFAVTGLTNGTAYTFRVAAVNHTRGDWSDSVTVTPSAVQVDADFDDVVLLLKMEGANGGTQFVDSSIAQNANTASGVSLSTSVKRFGDSAGAFGFGFLDGFSGVDLSSGSYTVETWFYAAEDNVGDNYNVATVNYNGSSSSRWILDLGVGGGIVNVRMITENNMAVASYNTPYTHGTWIHVAWVNDTDANTFSAYVNGVRIGQRSAVNLTKYEAMQIGKGGPSYSARAYYLDELRISRIARYSGATFGQPTTAHPVAATGTVYITQQPPATTQIAGSTGTITAAAIAYGEQSVVWQWQRSTDSGATWSNVAGATSATLSLTGQSSANAGDRYRAVASNLAGTSSATSTASAIAMLASTFSSKPASWTGAGFASDPVLSADALGFPWPAGSFRGATLTTAIAGTLRITGTADPGGDCNYTMISRQGGEYGFEMLFYGECDPPPVDITASVLAGDQIVFQAGGTFRNVSIWIVPS